MKEILSIKRDYIHVHTEQGCSYGGSQQFYKGLPGWSNRGKYRGGCGVVALGDLLIYLSSGAQRTKRNVFLHRLGADRADFSQAERYRAYFNRVCRWIVWCPTANGMSGVMLAVCFCWLMRCAGLPYRAMWVCSEKKCAPRIRRMLVRDIPVVLCIPKILMKRKKNGLLLYVREQEKMKPAVRTSAHYVVVTGIVEEKGKLYYRVSSWGKMYYISEEEYSSFVKKHLLGRLLGNILWIPE